MQEVKKPKILIVDDMPENLAVLFNLLNNNYEVIAAENGSIALEIIENDKPDIILLDIMMPDIDGYEVCKILKNSPVTEDIPVIFISALSETENVIKGLNLGAVDYITKPFHQEEVVLRIKTHLKISELTRKLENSNKQLEKKVKLRTKELENEITENKRMNDALQESEKKFKALFNGAPETMLLIDFESGEIIDINAAGCLLLKAGYDEIIGTNHGEIFVPSDESEKANINSMSEFNKKRVFANNLRKFDGEIIPIETAVKAVLVEGNLYMLGIVRDISERVKYQREILEAKEKAEEMNRLKSIFLANMSHELRTPLISILGFSEILLEEVGGELKEMVENIHVSGNRLSDTLNLLLRLTDIESGSMKAVKRVIYPSRLIKEVIDDYLEELQRKLLPVRLYLDEEAQIEADENMFKEIIRHIFKNAIKFTKHGEITVSLEVQKEFEEDIVKIIIADTGIGIKPEYIDLIFEPFRQGSEGNNRNYEGTGLGLTIAKRCLELNEAGIKVESEEGVGSKFILTFLLYNKKVEYSTENQMKESFNK
ncbi:MAG: response regulator [Melioribacteraceae bacterium]|nr:response regulator [Melioribacteraceae bacterium]